MHGIFNFSDIEATSKVISAEAALLRPAYRAHLRQIQDVSNLSAYTRFMQASPEEVGEYGHPDNPHIPAGYTYWGQFISHDITAHRFLGNVKPALRLRSLYGLGPGFAPYLYEYKPLQTAGLRFRGVKFFLEQYQSTFGDQVMDVPRYQLNPDRFMPERQNSIPLMADARNDQNFLLSQFTVQLMRLHNYLVNLLHQPGNEHQHAQLFQSASSALIACYQQSILNDYLPKVICEPTVIQALQQADRKNFVVFTGQKQAAGISKIFSTAAFRFGHSMVRQFYHTHARREPVPLFGKQLDLRGFVRDTRRAVDWSIFFEPGDKKGPQLSKKIDHIVGAGLSDLPFLRSEENNLIMVNLQQSNASFLDGRKFYQTFYKNRDLLTDKEQELIQKWSPEQLNTAIEALLPASLKKAPIPLWLYLLMEAEVSANGHTLGLLGSRIVAEQILWVLLDDPASVLHQPESYLEYLWGPASSAQLYSHFQVMEPLQDETHNPALTHKTAAAPEEIPGQQAYRGNEFHLVANQTDFEVYTKAVDNVVKRNGILSENFYDWGTPRNQDYVRLIRDNQFSEPLHRAKLQIRVYCSRRTLLYNLGHPDMSDPRLNGATDPNTVKGLLFIFGLDNASNIQFTVRPIDFLGNIARVGQQELVYFTDLKMLAVDNSWFDEQLNPVASPPNFTAHEHYAQLAGAFIKDGFVQLKMKGMPTPATISRSVILKMLAMQEWENDPQRQIPRIEFWLSAAKGKDIIKTHALETPEGWPSLHVPNASFFNLALRSADNQAGTFLYSENTRPYPYWCYNG